MKIALVQMDLAWCDTQANLQHAEELMRRQLGADVYVLPEMFTTGFSMSATQYAEEGEGKTLTALKACAVVVTDDILQSGLFYATVHGDEVVESLVTLCMLWGFPTR